jgi:hypothetical protein
MSKAFYIALVVIFAGAWAQSVWLNLHLRAVNDDVTAVCYKPVGPMPKRLEVFWFPPGKPVMGVMTR